MGLIVVDYLTMGPVGCFETSVTTSLRCVTSQKSEDLIYTGRPEITYSKNYINCS
jgi:hypothetical protein